MINRLLQLSYLALGYRSEHLIHSQCIQAFQDTLHQYLLPVYLAQVEQRRTVDIEHGYIHILHTFFNFLKDVLYLFGLLFAATNDRLEGFSR